MLPLTTFPRPTFHMSLSSGCSLIPWFRKGIRQLQLVLLKVALLLGVEVHVNVEFKRLVEPPGNQEGHSESLRGWRNAQNTRLVSQLNQINWLHCKLSERQQWWHFW